MTRPKNHTWWTRDEGAVIQHAEFDGGRLALEVAFSDRRYEVELAPAPDGPTSWRGAWTRPGQPGTGSVSGRLYRTADGGFALVGEWNEDGGTYHWVAEFHAAR